MTLIQCFHIALESWAAVFCVIAAMAIYPARAFDRGSAYTCILLLLTDALLNVAEVLSWIFRGRDGLAAYILVRASVYVVLTCIFLLLIFASCHLAMVITTRGGTVDLKMLFATIGIAVIGIVLVTISMFIRYFYTFDEHNAFYQTENYPVIVILAELALFPILIQTLENRHALRKREFFVFLIMYFLPALGGLVQMNIEDVSSYNAANSVTLILLVLVHQYEYTADMIEVERARANEQISLYTRQIQPHFIYNSLSAIRSYLPVDSKAWETLNHFAGFLRGSIDLLTAEGCIPAEREFATVEDYLFMEKERFGEDLMVETDFADVDFVLPAFTVQTLVENAVNHGVRKNPGGRGHLSVKSYRTRDSHIIEIRDDGAGYEPGAPVPTTASTATSVPAPGVSPAESSGGHTHNAIGNSANLHSHNAFAGNSADGHTHIGVENVRNRLKLMCDATLYIESSPGTGTFARVTIPI